MNKKRVYVIMGGISDEREVSLRSGKQVADNLPRDLFEVHELPFDNTVELTAKLLELRDRIDLAFIVLHGIFGEDGRIQSILEALEIPYTGCGVTCSAVSMNKDLTKRICSLEGVNTPAWFTVRSVEEIEQHTNLLGGFEKPFFAKPVCGGSSVATLKVHNMDELRTAVSLGLQHDREVIVESFIKGREVTCPVLWGRQLPVLEIIPKKGEFFDYTSKYADGGSDELPVELPAATAAELSDYVAKAWRALDCRGYARFDFIIDENEKPWFLEVNTLPGMTAASLFPKSAAAAGMTFGELLTKMAGE